MSREKFASSTYNDFTDVTELYRSTSGAIYKARFKYDRNFYVLKERKISELGRAKDVMNEVKLLQQLRHANVVQCEGWFRDLDRGTLFMVLEYCGGGDLSQIIAAKKKRREHFSESEIWRIFVQLASGLCHLHENGIIHRDIKALNVFYDPSRNIYKIGDLGVSRQVSEQTALVHTFHGTPLYLSPELIENSAYNEKTDIWSLGILLYELCALVPPFRASSLVALAKVVLKGDFEDIPNLYSSSLSRLIRWMLSKDYTKRPSVVQVLDFAAQQIQRQQQQQKSPSRESILHNAQVHPPAAATRRSSNNNQDNDTEDEVDVDSLDGAAKGDDDDTASHGTRSTSSQLSADNPRPGAQNRPKTPPQPLKAHHAEQEGLRRLSSQQQKDGQRQVQQPQIQQLAQRPSTAKQRSNSNFSAPPSSNNIGSHTKGNSNSNSSNNMVSNISSKRDLSSNHNNANSGANGMSAAQPSSSGARPRSSGGVRESNDGGRERSAPASAADNGDLDNLVLNLNLNSNLVNRRSDQHEGGKSSRNPRGNDHDGQESKKQVRHVRAETEVVEERRRGSGKEVSKDMVEVSLPRCVARLRREMLRQRKLLQMRDFMSCVQSSDKNDGASVPEEVGEGLSALLAKLSQVQQNIRWLQMAIDKPEHVLPLHVAQALDVLLVKRPPTPQTRPVVPEELREEEALPVYLQQPQQLYQQQRRQRLQRETEAPAQDNSDTKHEIVEVKPSQQHQNARKQVLLQVPPNGNSDSNGRKITEDISPSAEVNSHKSHINRVFEVNVHFDRNVADNAADAQKPPPQPSNMRSVRPATASSHPSKHRAADSYEYTDKIGHPSEHSSEHPSRPRSAQMPRAPEGLQLPSMRNPPASSSAVSSAQTGKGADGTAGTSAGLQTERQRFSKNYRHVSDIMQALEKDARFHAQPTPLSDLMQLESAADGKEIDPRHDRRRRLQQEKEEQKVLQQQQAESVKHAHRRHNAPADDADLLVQRANNSDSDKRPSTRSRSRSAGANAIRQRQQRDFNVITNH